jgi:hypothetical protein
VSKVTAVEASNPFWCRCEKCSHTWIAAYTPMNATLFARIARRHSRCPKCDGRGLVAKQDNGVLLETST